MDANGMTRAALIELVGTAGRCLRAASELASRHGMDSLARELEHRQQEVDGSLMMVSGELAKDGIPDAIPA